MRRYGEPSKDQERLLPHQFCSDCIIATRGYDFREGHRLGFGVAVVENLRISLAFPAEERAVASSAMAAPDATSAQSTAAAGKGRRAILSRSISCHRDAASHPLVQPPASLADHYAVVISSATRFAT